MKAWFLNLGPSTTTNREANADIEAILATGPALLTGCEANGKGELPGLRGYQRIRDTSKPGRANLFAYVDKSQSVQPVEWKWTDCNKEFPRNQAPGMHWARSILQFPFMGEQIVVAHKPPLWKGAGEARWEHDRKLQSILNPADNLARSRLLLWDCNGMSGAEALAKRVKGRVVGKHIDSAIVRKVTVEYADYTQVLNGHRFATDHPWGALVIKFKWVD